MNVSLPESESALVKRAKRDPAAFGLLYERYIDKIYSYIYLHTSSRQDAEDLTSRTFHQALTNIRRYDERGVPFAAWLYRIAHNLVANWHRDRSRKPQAALDDWLKWLMRSSPSPADVAEQNSEMDALRAAFQKLPTDRQQLLILKYGESLSNLEIGRALHRSEGAIKSLLYRTLEELRIELRKHGYS